MFSCKIIFRDDISVLSEEAGWGAICGATPSTVLLSRNVQALTTWCGKTDLNKMEVIIIVGPKKLDAAPRRSTLLVALFYGACLYLWPVGLFLFNMPLCTTTWMGWLATSNKEFFAETSFFLIILVRYSRYLLHISPPLFGFSFSGPALYNKSVFTPFKLRVVFPLTIPQPGTAHLYLKLQRCAELDALYMLTLKLLVTVGLKFEEPDLCTILKY